jgi:predicted Zn-dependent protease
VKGANAVYFNGSTALRRPVRADLDAQGIAFLDQGLEPVRWRLEDLRCVDSPAGTLRLAAAGAPDLARLEIGEAQLIEAILQRVPALGRRRRADEGALGRIVFWSLAAVASLVLTAAYLVPLVADRLAPLIPVPLERRLGEAVGQQVRTLFGARTCVEEPGRVVLGRLTERLAAAADLPMPVRVEVLTSGVPNALTLPGGNVYVFRALLDKAHTPDEFAGVLAHELGHVAGRDALRKLLQTAGTSFLLGLLFGDVTGGGAIIFVAQSLVDSRYSRQAESAADAFAARLMLLSGRSTKPLAAFLARLDANSSERFAFINSHPVTVERMRALEAADRPAAGPPLLDDADWRALKAICDRTE